MKEAGTRATNYAEAKVMVDPARYAKFFWAMCARGVYLAPSQFEAAFLSTAHTSEDIATTLQAAREALKES